MTYHAVGRAIITRHIIWGQLTLAGLGEPSSA